MSRFVYSIIVLCLLLGCGSNTLSLDTKTKSEDERLKTENEQGIPLVSSYVKRVGSKYQLVDARGNVLSDSYDEIAPMISGEYFWVRNDRLFGFIDKNGTLTVPIQYEQVGSFFNDRAYFKKNGKYGYINSKGQQVIPASYDEVMDFTFEYAWVKKNMPSCKFRRTIEQGQSKKKKKK